ncbi:hypothetical protein P2318_14040 [Myxococcaceae bacterium GXIMD 01537]
MPRVIYLVHTSPGRTRLRLPSLRRLPKDAEQLAEGLQHVEGVEEVEVRPFTGSVLCVHDPYVLSVERLLAEVTRLTDVTVVVRPGDVSSEEEVELRRALAEGSGVARAAAQAFKGVNVDVLRATGGRMDLGTLTTLCFMLAGAVEVAMTRKLDAPKWFNLGWWAFRTFATIEEVAIEHAESPMRHASDGPGSTPSASEEPLHDA